MESDVCDEVEIQLSYAIGVAEPLSVAIDTFGTGKVADEVILAAISKYFDCRPGMITQEFSLRKPKFKYRDLAALGHFGRPDINIPWEETNKAQALKSYFKKYLV